MVKNTLYLTALMILGCMFILTEAGLAETKNVISKNIMHNLGASAQLTKKNWIFSFSEDRCVFHKTRKFMEMDGALISEFDIEIPLPEIIVESEEKTYDSFFQCKEFKNCIEKSWKDGSGKTFESKMTNTASLYLENVKLRNTIYKLFHKLQSLCDRSSYPGPLGLKWGENIEKATIQLSKKLKVPVGKKIKNEIILQQEYRDDFASIPTEKIYVSFIEDKFYEMTVILESEKSLAEAWHKTTRKMIDKYGEPNKIVLPAAIKSLDDFVNKHFFSNFKVFDLEIKTGNWKPLAKWIYTNNVVILVEVVPHFKEWQARWRFFHVDLANSALDKVKKIRTDDF